MNSRLKVANICRTIARIGSVLVLLLGIPYLLFVGLQLVSEHGTPSIYLYLLLLFGFIVGLVIAWWREGLGAAIALASLVGLLALSGALLPGVGSGDNFALFSGPIHLLFALLMPGYNTDRSPAAKLVPLISWLLEALPVLLFFASWWLRKAPKPKIP